MIPNIVIIWGIDNFNTLGLLRQIGDEVESFLLVYGSRSGCATNSKYCKDYAIVQTIEDGFDYLKCHFSQEPCKPVIITPGDEIIEFIDQHKTEFEEYFIVPGTAEAGVLTKYDNKIEMARLAKEIGMDVPFSVTCKWDTPLDDVRYPCFLKPSHITSGHKNEFKCKKVEDRHELEKTLKLVRHDSEFLLQQYIPVEKEYVVSGCRMMDGETVIVGCYTTLRYADDGNSSYARVDAEIPSCIDTSKIKAFVEQIDYYGLFGFEYGLYQGKAYFFEVNLRNDGTSQTFWLAGANRPLAWVYSACGMDYSKVGLAVERPGFFIDELMDVSNVWHGRIGLKEWRKQRRDAAYLKYYKDDDMQPFRAMKKKRWRMLLQYAVVKKFRLYIVYVLDKMKRT